MAYFGNFAILFNVTFKNYFFIYTKILFKFNDDEPYEVELSQFCREKTVFNLDLHVYKDLS